MNIFPPQVTLTDEGPEHPVETFIKTMAEGEIADPTWLASIGAVPAISLSKRFLRKSDARLARVKEKISVLFQGHDEEMQEAFRIVEEIRDDVREEALVAQ